MTPILFSATTTDFTGSSICPLVDALSVRVTEDDNGTFVLEMDYPSTGRFFNEIKLNRIIFAKPSMTQDPQPFDIKSMTIDERGMATFYARHVYYRLKNYICSPRVFRNNGMYTGYVLQLSLQTQHPSSYGSWHMREPGISAPFNCYIHGGFFYTNKLVRCPISAYKVLQDYMLGASTEFETEAIKPIEVKFDEFRTDLYFTEEGYYRGQFRPIVLRVGSNVHSMSYEIDYSDCVQWIMPFWRKLGEDEHGLATQDIVLLTTQVPDGEGGTYPAYSNNSINRESEWDVTQVLPTYFYEVPVDLSSEFTEKPSASMLFDAAKQWLKNNSIDQPYANLQVEFAPTDPDMDKLYTQAIGAGTIGLYDTCTVSFEEIGLTTTMKVVKTVYNTLLERYERLEFGTLQRTIYTTGNTRNTETITPEYDVVIDDDPYVPAVDPDTDEEITPE